VRSRRIGSHCSNEAATAIDDAMRAVGRRMDEVRIG
jgi:hypothetical protein